MPKETIYGDPNDRFVLDVGWNRDMDVQIGIRTVDDLHLVDEFYGQEAVMRKIGYAVRQHRDVIAAIQPDPKAVTDEALGRLVLDAVTGSDFGMSSLWWHPGRQQVNTLIRTLRKARDAAFGSDA